MKTQEKNLKKKDFKLGNLQTDSALSDRPISKAELRKLEAAREFLKKHPVPEHLLRR